MERGEEGEWVGLPERCCKALALWELAGRRPEIRRLRCVCVCFTTEQSHVDYVNIF